MEPDTRATSRNYAAAQSILLCLFAAAFFLDSSPRLFASRGAAAGGAVLCLAGLVLMFVAFISLRRVIQVAPEPRAGGHLVTSGIYKYLRHPIYTAILILVAGLFLRKPTAFMGTVSAITIIFFLFKVRVEEKLLLARYPEYGEYKRRAWGIIPGIT